MSGDTSGQKKAKKYTSQQIAQLQQGYTDLQANPLFTGGEGIVQQLVDQPLSMDPATVERIRANAIGGAQGAYQGNMDQLQSRAGAQGAYRSGNTRQGERVLSADLGNTIGGINRDIDIRAAMQRNSDLLNAANAVLPFLQVRGQFPRDIANAYGGASSNPIWQQDSAGEAFWKSVGNVVSGTAFSKGGSAGAFGGGGAGGGGGGGGAATSGSFGGGGGGETFNGGLSAGEFSGF